MEVTLHWYCKMYTGINTWYSPLWCLPVCLSIWKVLDLYCLCILPFYSFAVHTPFKKSTLTYLVGIFRINASRIVHISFNDKCFQLMFCGKKILRTPKVLETKLNHYYCCNNNLSNKLRKLIFVIPIVNFIFDLIKTWFRFETSPQIFFSFFYIKQFYCVFCLVNCSIIANFCMLYVV